MPCPVIDPDAAGFLRAFQRKAERERIPLSGGVALTERCNLRCAHCFTSPCALQPEEELTTSEWRDLLDQLAEAGCLYLLITGGEPSLRTDFVDLYAHARRKGLIVTVFTNATRVTPAILEAFQASPPRAVEVTLYGSNAAVYESITGVPGSFRRCMEGIEQLVRAGLPVRLKTMLMRPNLDDFEAIRARAADWGVPFRFDAVLTADLDGNDAPLRLRLPPDVALRREFDDPRVAEDWRALAERFNRKRVKTRLYDCGAGLTTFFIDSAGLLYPCQMARSVRWDARRKGFAKGWKDVIPEVQSAPMPPDMPCVTCEARVVCSYCAASFALETGDPGKPSPFVCALGKGRLRVVDGGRIEHER